MDACVHYTGGEEICRGDCMLSNVHWTRDESIVLSAINSRISLRLTGGINIRRCASLVGMAGSFHARHPSRPLSSRGAYGKGSDVFDSDSAYHCYTKRIEDSAWTSSKASVCTGIAYQQ